MKINVFWVVGVCLIAALGYVSIAVASHNESKSHAQIVQPESPPAKAVSNQALLECNDKGCFAKMLYVQGETKWTEVYAVYPSIASGMIESGCVLDDSERPEGLKQGMRPCQVAAKEK